MALLLKGNALFLHVPKTGGNWVTKVLREMDLIVEKIGHKHADMDHVLLSEHRQMLIKQKPFMFCFVRHPLRWYESWYKYMSQPRRQWCEWGSEREIDNWHPNSMLNSLGSSDFNKFVRNVAQKRAGYVTEMFGWYTKPPIDFIGRQENLREDLITALRLAKVHFNPDIIYSYPEVGVSPVPDTVFEWDAYLGKQIEMLEYAGLVRYGYAASNYVLEKV